MYQCACVWRLEAPGVPRQGISSPRQGISGSQQGAIIFQTVKLLFSIVRSTYATHENVDFFGSEMVQNLLSVTVHLPALQNMVITKHNSSQYIALP